MSSDAFSRAATLPAGLVLLTLVLLVGEVTAETWKRANQLPPSERERLEIGVEPPSRENGHLPKEPYPFEPPYTAEELGYLRMEFAPRLSRWSHELVTLTGVLTGGGYLSQRAIVMFVLQEHGPGLESYLYELEPGDTEARSIFYMTFPPEQFGAQQLWVTRRIGPGNTTPTDFFLYSKSLRRVRRMPSPRRDQRFRNNAQSFDDMRGRDAWEFDWRILGTDVLYETVRFPETRPTVTLAEGKGDFVEVDTRNLKLMGETYPFYREDGGVDCYVVEATPKKAWLPDYRTGKVLYWLDQHYFYPLRMEKYDREGNLTMIEVRIAKQENPELGRRGYASLFIVDWNVPLDLMTYAVHDAHVLREWSDSDREIFFTPEFLARDWLLTPLKTHAFVESPKDFYLRPRLDRDKFPRERDVDPPRAVLQRYEAQEKAGRLVFR